MSMIRRAAAVVVAMMLVPVAAPALRAQAGKTYKARLSPMPVDGPPMMATIAGTGSVTAILSGNTLTITGSFAGLKSAATAIKIHRAIKGVRGPAVLDLKPPPSAVEGPIAASVDLSPAQVDDLARERLYLELDSEKAPDGNLWGWFLLQENKR
jgi:hypothetical protein